MIFTIVWRNIWRKKARSLVIIIAVTIGIWAGLFISGVFTGMIAQQKQDAISHYLSDIQIHQPRFLDNYEIQYTIPDAAKTLAVIENNPKVKAASMRTVIYGMVASANDAGGAKITGVIPSKESKLTNMGVFMKQGTYFGDNKRNSILIGEKLAKKLNVKLHSKVVLTFSTKDGEILSGAFRIGGIYKTSNAQADAMNVFVNAHDINNMIGADSGYHEIAVLMKDDMQTDAPAQTFRSQFPGLKVETWEEISPATALMSGMTDYVLSILMTVLMLGLAFAIINTMLMTVMERTRELGMLMAIGMNKRRTFSMLMYETIILSFLGCPIGMGIAWLTIHYFGTHGIDLSSFSKGLENFGFSTMVYTSLRSTSYIQVSIMVLITAILAAIYPGLKAIRLKPAEAIRHI